MHLDLLSIPQSGGKNVVFFPLTDRASTIPSNIRGYQSIWYVVCWTGKDQTNIYKAANFLGSGTGFSSSITRGEARKYFRNSVIETVVLGVAG